MFTTCGSASAFARTASATSKKVCNFRVVCETTSGACNRGSFAIHGFGEASLAYFNKDLREVNLQEAAFLAGIIHAPNRYSGSERRPERAVEARDRALLAMTEDAKEGLKAFGEKRKPSWPGK